MKCNICKNELLQIKPYEHFERYGSYCVVCERWVENDEI